MSGFEVAGIVLGAFPLAIEALDRYREVAKRLGFWYKIRLEYQKCSDHLTYYRLAYRRHLKLLLLPLVVDDDKIQELLSDPGGEGWKNQAVASLLEVRLDESYELYLRHMTATAEVMQKLNHELAVNDDSVQQTISTSKGPMKARMKHAMSKDGIDYHRYKVKFMNGASVRGELFAEIKDLLERMRDLLDTSDKESQLLGKRASAAKNSAIDAAICGFFVHANRLFRALTSAWNCYCQQQHCVRLLLQHRTNKKSEFEVVFAKSLPSSWEVRKTRIVEGGDIEAGQVSTIRIPAHREKQPIKSALRTRAQVPAKDVERTLPAITLTTTTALPDDTDVPPITSLCISLDQGNEPCCGFLAEEDCRYYVYKLSRLQMKTLSSISLDEILRGQVQPAPTRRQRYSLALTLASSFLQLLDTPWLPVTWSKSDIVFTSSVADSGVFALDQPHLDRGLVDSEKNASKSSTFLQSLDLLGIVLLELCFGVLLENRACRTRWPPGRNETEKMAFDFMAAREWQLEVNEEAGPDYSEAVAWCLGGNRSTPPEVWRREMLQKVVQPLERCRQFLSGGAGGN
ncbi:hypothetical protein AK830_g8421 [Neonectria ditissima]|uniref:DUF7580 domain-containing protein n=1 Tax=Neonectria ditissima TaxID=78410 RepID=A0A0N8H673_9HYPO|nr:hypothetical protein AK830_g8421 [Neonectria ditissima]